MAPTSDRNGTRRQSNSRSSTGQTRTRSNASTAKTTGSKGRTTAKQNSSKKKNQDFSVMDEIILIIVFAIVIFLFLCTVGIIGTPKGSDSMNLGDYVQAFMLGVFGYAAVIVPIVTFFVLALGISNRNNTFVWFKIGSLIALVMVVGVLMHMISYGADLETFSEAKDWPKIFYENAKGGGVVFGAIALLFCSLIGRVGTAFVLMVLSIIALVLLTGKSFIKGVKKGTKKIYQTTKEESGHIKELSSKIREDVKNARFSDEEEYDDSDELIPRRRRRATGVTMDTELVKTSPTQKTSDEVEEVKKNEKKEDIAVSMSDMIEVKPEPVEEKESSDIHQIEYKSAVDEEEWMQPVSVRKNREEEDFIKPVQNKNTETKTVEMHIPDDEPLPVVSTEEVAPAKPVAHLRSRDKSSMSGVLDTPVKDSMLPPNYSHRKHNRATQGCAFQPIRERAEGYSDSHSLRNIVQSY